MLWTYNYAEESVAEQVARLLAHQAGSRASPSPENCKMIGQSPCLSVRSDKSAGSDIRSRSQLPKHKHTLHFADAIGVAPTPKEKKT